MPKKAISASIEASTESKVRKQAKKDKRSFSSMVDFILTEYIKNKKK